jgi:hypothetical protein
MKKVILFIIFLPGLVYLPLFILEINSGIVYFISHLLWYEFHYQSAFSPSGNTFSEENMWWQTFIYLTLLILELFYILKYLTRKWRLPNKSTENIPVSVWDKVFSEAKKCNINPNIEEESHFYFNRGGMIVTTIWSIWVCIWLIITWILKIQVILWEISLYQSDLLSILSWKEIIGFSIWIPVIIFFIYFIYENIRDYNNKSAQLTINKKWIYYKKTDKLYIWEYIVWESFNMGKYWDWNIEFYYKPTNEFIVLYTYNLNISKSSFQRVFETHRARSNFPYYHYVRTSWLGLALPVTNN